MLVSFERDGAAVRGSQWWSRSGGGGAAPGEKETGNDGIHAPRILIIEKNEAPGPAF